MNSEIATTLICFLTAGVTCLAFRRPDLHERLLFKPERILAAKEWHRLVSSALVHGDWIHLCFNLITLYSFGHVIEAIYGWKLFLAIYFASVLGGSLLSLYLHRHHDYSAHGASGGVCGVMFACIFLVPGMSVGDMILPIRIPGPIYAAAYLVVSFVGLRKSVGNIGHDAHFGGAVTGLIFAWQVAPELCLRSPWLFIGASVFSVVCLVIIARDPLAISDKVFGGKSEFRSNVRYQRYDEGRARRVEREEIDRILDKIARHGLDSISKKERMKLEQASVKFSRS